MRTKIEEVLRQKHLKEILTFVGYKGMVRGTDIREALGLTRWKTLHDAITKAEHLELFFKRFIGRDSFYSLSAEGTKVYNTLIFLDGQSFHDCMEDFNNNLLESIKKEIINKTYSSAKVLTDANLKTNYNEVFCSDKLKDNINQIFDLFKNIESLK